MVAVISQDEILTFWHHPFTVAVTLISPVGFDESLSVDTDRAIRDDHPVTWQADHALDVIFAIVAIVVEDNNFATFWFAKAICQAIDEQVIALVEGGAHAIVDDRDPDGDGIDHHKNEHRHQDGFE